MGEIILVRFKVLSHFDDAAWIGIMPAGVSPSVESKADADCQVSYCYFSGFQDTTWKITAAWAGSWDLRLYGHRDDYPVTEAVRFTVEVSKDQILAVLLTIRVAPPRKHLPPIGFVVNFANRTTSK